MKARLFIGIAIVCLTTAMWALPACGDESPDTHQKNFYLKCINAEIDNYSCKVVHAASRSRNLQLSGENAALRTVFLSQNKKALVQEMLEQKVSMHSHAVHQYLLNRFNQESHIKTAKMKP